ncbi:MAG: hypothetical protein ACRCT1_10930 [Microcoleaceae cyanobacterium]
MHPRKKQEGRRKKEEGRREKEEGRRKKGEGRRKKEEGRRKKNLRVIVYRRSAIGVDYQKISLEVHASQPKQFIISPRKK